ncbi:CDC73-domain-containing protein [Suhomyces tanzawaensis NRRL Y-17324]|uniref:CDC73-domain-containing protein n=1 Tax=Suhomyces tanzawaensis NRRL Y-17324 TaxID=984487 RepID=A0A1E4SMU8_9ASCO|nr:CDC73-domain-containing protein [Suhomyces tanzawaensis NRRL Y-17324]ODV80816.1 CDC73-domain-containing protein [Suhomyces tanzawaensis NRRL Y-17324]
MSGAVAIKALHSATTASAPIKLLKGEDEETQSIKDASHVKFGDSSIFELDSITNFYNEEQPQSLRAVVFCWLHDKSSIVDYKNECLENGIADFKFLVKTELNTWLNGNSDSCTFVKDEVEQNPVTAEESQQTEASAGKKHKLEDPKIERISGYERESIDHNAALRGSKNIDFGYLVSDAKRLISQLKRSKPNTQSKASSSTAQKKQPIIIVSPATTSLLSLSNIKEFFEEGRFTEPNPTNKPSGGLVTLTHKSDRLIPSAQQIMVVDNVEMFTKPEYWDRVIAIFTTGQAWQFAKYKYSKPELLFQKYAGFYVSYQGEPTPSKIREWNISQISVDRGEKRFRDKMIVRDFWADIDKILIAKGYGKQ